tara:strand:+ start:455 stop:1738 length:1284 start_codon:yes stop_codon:yes gene_type:complete
MDILKNLNSIDTESIKKLKEVTHLDKCKVCNDTINTDTDESVTYSSDLNAWIHRDCLNEVQLCVVCKRPAIHLEQDICSKCMNNHSVRNYSYKPDSRFHRVNTKKNEPLTSFSGESKHGMPILHFGVEIEVDVHADQDDYDNNIVLDGNNFASLTNIVGSAIPGTDLFYCKTDSSLSDDGIEIVSHPFSWNFWKTYGQSIYDTLFSTIRNSGYYSAEGSETGMHIHISKRAIKKSHLLKLLWFIYESPNFIELIAQRSSYFGMATYDSLLGYTPDTFKLKVSKLTSVAKRRFSSNAERYTALNMEPSESIEFRIFKGTLNIMTLSKAIEFIHSLLSYCAESSISDIVNKNNEEKRVDRYLQFLSRNQSKYMNLCLFLNNEMELSTQKKNKYFTESRTRLGRRLLVDHGLREGRVSNSFKTDSKGVLV